MRRVAVLALAVLLLWPALPVLALRFVPPLGSALMVQRWVEAHAAGRSFRIQYQWVPARQMAPSLRAAVIASEDQRFFEHSGFDWHAMWSALGEMAQRRQAAGRQHDLAAGREEPVPRPGRSFLRKGLEAWLTLWIELLWPKQRILEVYLNVAELGDGVFGAEAAAHRYFGRSAARLGPHESALLAAMLPSPRRSNPANPSRFLRERQQWILRQLT